MNRSLVGSVVLGWGLSVMTGGCQDTPTNGDPTFGSNATGTTAGSDGSSGNPPSPTSSTAGPMADGTTSGETIVLELSPTDDTYVRDDNGNDQDTIHGDLDQFLIENDDPRFQQAYLRFEVDDIEGEIVSASLRLTVTEPSFYGGDIFQVDDTDPNTGMQWTEDSLTWNTALPINGPPLDSVTQAPNEDEPVSFNVTTAVQLGAPVSFGITTPNDDTVGYASKENMDVDPPLLIVTVAVP